MNEEVLEHELKDTYINPILNAFFSLQEKFKYRAPEQNLPERVYRTEFSKKPDAIVSTIVFSHFSYTKLVGEVKNETYQLESLAVLYDKYKLGIYGKDIVDKGVAKVILFQAVGKWRKSSNDNIKAYTDNEETCVKVSKFASLRAS
jgi:hypothetical protein